jgi:hypothetical protein
MLFSELCSGDWFVLLETFENDKPITMSKLEFPVQPMGFCRELKPFTAVSINSGSFFSIPDDAEVIKVSQIFEELPVGDRFILVDDFGNSKGAVINEKVERPSDKPSRPGPVYFIRGEKYGSMLVPPPGRKVIKIV